MTGSYRKKNLEDFKLLIKFCECLKERFDHEGQNYKNLKPKLDHLQNEEFMSIFKLHFK